MLRTNRDCVVAMAVECKPRYPVARTWMVGVDGGVNMGIGCGGIHYNVKVGDLVCKFEGDHVEPGVSCQLADAKGDLACFTFGCVGNQARVLTGQARGAKGVVTGHHGGDGGHTIIDFPQAAIEKMSYEDLIQIRGCGQGLKLLDFPAVSAYALDPGLLDRMGIKAVRGSLEAPVTACFSAKVMGAGLGTISSFRGDYDIQTSDPGMNQQLGLDKLRLGDFVALLDQEARYGYSFREGAVSIGVIIHGDSPVAGHGPGVQVLLTTSQKGLIRPVISPNANLGAILKIGRWRK